MINKKSTGTNQKRLICMYISVACFLNFQVHLRYERQFNCKPSQQQSKNTVKPLSIRCKVRQNVIICGCEGERERQKDRSKLYNNAV